MKNPLYGCVIVLCGDFGPARSADKIKQWVELNGGRYTTNINRQTTHLVCSKERYKKTAPLVKQAKAATHVKIVTYDWLEDSLLDKRRKAEKEYLFSRREKKIVKKKLITAAARRKVMEEGVKKYHQDCKDFARDMQTDGYHIYRDSTGFEYNLTLARADLTYNINERYYIKIYETHVEPHKYACFVTYSSPRSPYIKEQLAPTGSSFELAYANFRDFFKLKTKMAWEDRLLGEGGKDATAFVWQPPAVTEPQGMMVKDYLGLNG